MRRLKTRQIGITLIELMVVVMIVAVLAGVGYPTYRQYAIRANRTEAKAALLQVTQALEKCYTRYHAYNHADCEVDTDFSTASGQYTISAAAIDETTYTINAAPQGGQADDTQCGTLSVNELGQHMRTGSADNCW